MFEARKTNAVRGPAFLERYLSGSVLDIGCGDDLVVPHARPFDVVHGDANAILDHLSPCSFDGVHSSHCLEHMRDVPGALAQWWALVKPGGHLVLVVPHEDLYEQGVWPSLFNGDHRATFRLDTPASWSPVSYELRSLLQALPGAEVVDLCIQDHGYDRRLQRFGVSPLGRALWWLSWRRRAVTRRLGRYVLSPGILDRWCERIERLLGKPVDQTWTGALAQIQAVVRKSMGPAG
jgi:SAM-dependent methyltransferase